MKFKKNLMVLVGVIILLVSQIVASEIDLSARLPLCPDTVVGRLDNGLTYFIRRNSEPANIAELRLALRIGSVDEDDDQQGLAHFVEHMAFNGTEHFPNETLLDYLNSVGAGFGGGTNAATGQEMTFYMTSARTDVPEQIDTGFLILSDWAHRLTFDHEEIDSERGVILEEIRGGRGVQERIMAQQRHAYFGDSKYAERMPGGLPEVIENFEYQRLKDFYNDWYRPDLQAVIAVGDFDVEEIRALIVKHFADIPMPENPRPREIIYIPEHTDTKFSFASDREMPYTTITLMYKSAAKSYETIGDFKRALTMSLLNMMLQNRFEEIVTQVDPPFIMAFGGSSQMLRTMDMYMNVALVDENKILEGHTALVTEIERALRYGFYDSELARAVDEILTAYEKQYLEKDKTRSSSVSFPLMFAFIRDTAYLGAEDEYELAQQLINTITMDDIRTALATSITDANRVIAISTTENIASEIPSEDVFIAVFDAVKAMDLEMYTETVIDEDLLPEIPQSVAVAQPTHDSEMDVYTWTLENGAKVHLKTTDFRNNEIIFIADRLGGNTHVDDEYYHITSSMPAIMAEAGLGNFTKNQLERYLAGKDVSLSTNMTGNFERLRGRSSVRDFETMLQMMWQYFNNPRYDEEAFERWVQRTEIMLRNVENNPEHMFQMAGERLLWNDHPRSREMRAEDLDDLFFDYDAGFDYFRERFSSANDFHFMFVGNITREQLQPFIERYIAPLPNLETSNAVIDRNLRYNQTSTRENIYRGIENKSDVLMMFTNEYVKDTKESLLVRGLSFILFEMLREEIREKNSSVYMVQAYPALREMIHPQFALNIEFGCDPEKVEEIIEAIKEQINILLSGEFDDKYFNATVETFKRSIEIETRTNGFWLNNIHEIYVMEKDKHDVINPMNIVNSVTKADMVRIANTYIDFEKLLILVMYPEEGN